MRKLPIYFVIDKCIHSVKIQNAVERMVARWKTDPFLLEITEIAIIYYTQGGSKAYGFDEIYEFDFSVNEESESDNILPLDLITQHIKANVKETTSKVKGDYKPFIIIFSGDTVSNNTLGSIMDWRTNLGNKTNMIVFDLGEKTNSVLTDTDHNEDRLKLTFNVLTRNKFHIRPIEDLDLFLQLLDFIANTIAKISTCTPQRNIQYVYHLINKNSNTSFSLELIHPGV